MSTFSKLKNARTSNLRFPIKSKVLTQGILSQCVETSSVTVKINDLIITLSLVHYRTNRKGRAGVPGSANEPAYAPAGIVRGLLVISNVESAVEGGKVSPKDKMSIGDIVSWSYGYTPVFKPVAEVSIDNGDLFIQHIDNTADNNTFKYNSVVITPYIEGSTMIRVFKIGNKIYFITHRGFAVYGPDVVSKGIWFDGVDLTGTLKSLLEREGIDLFGGLESSSTVFSLLLTIPNAVSTEKRVIQGSYAQVLKGEESKALKKLGFSPSPFDMESLPVDSLGVAGFRAPTRVTRLPKITTSEELRAHLCQGYGRIPEGSTVHGPYIKDNQYIRTNRPKEGHGASAHVTYTYKGVERSARIAQSSYADQVVVGVPAVSTGFAKHLDEAYALLDKKIENNDLASIPHSFRLSNLKVEVINEIKTLLAGPPSDVANYNQVLPMSAYRENPAQIFQGLDLQQTKDLIRTLAFIRYFQALPFHKRHQLVENGVSLEDLPSTLKNDFTNNEVLFDMFESTMEKYLESVADIPEHELYLVTKRYRILRRVTAYLAYLKESAKQHTKDNWLEWIETLSFSDQITMKKDLLSKARPKRTEEVPETEEVKTPLQLLAEARFGPMSNSSSWAADVDGESGILSEEEGETYDYIDDLYVAKM